MITKQLERIDRPSNPLRRAGIDAERQMAHYLHRAFADNRHLHVLNNLRIVDPDQPEHDGTDGRCQIDHLVLHRWGMFIVESKSVTDTVKVRSDGAGGDEWVRTFKGREGGFHSPLRQAADQAAFLRHLLNAHRERLLGKVAPVLRVVTKVVAGTDQRGFAHMPIQAIVAISDRGRIERACGWEPPAKPFQSFVCKADQVTQKISDEWDRHRKAANLLAARDGDYGVWSMFEDELASVAQFLADHHTPLHDAAPTAQWRNPAPASAVDQQPSPPAAERHPVASRPACKHCGSPELSAHWGKYGYYWKCAGCGRNTAMPTSCSACRAEGKGGKGVRIRKEGPNYSRHCDACGNEECIWTDS